MEASQQNPPQDQGATSQQDSALQTTQPDQPVPTEAERQAETTPETPSTDGNATATEDGPQGPTASVGPSGQPAEGTTSGSPYPTGAEQQLAEDQRQQELEQARREHNERTGGGAIQEGELQAQREEHNARTAGEQPPSADSVDGSQDQDQA